LDYKLVLMDVNREIYEQFLHYFSDTENVEIHHKPFQELNEFDCIVSPANSFGLMNGGLDKYLVEFFGKEVEDKVQQHILDCYAGEQPIGTSFIIETNHPKHPFLAHTPTMRIPERINGTDNPYLAMKAMLLAIKHHNRTHEKKIHSVACSGLGTMVGGFPASLAVQQMRIAFDVVNKPNHHQDWITAVDHHERIERLKGEEGSTEREYGLAELLKTIRDDNKHEEMIVDRQGKELI
jgi:O-acetyl-ADP-ribose deacetylase (regulator of RNase III)